MLIADKLIPQGRGLASPLLARAATVSLEWEQRSRSRIEAVDDRGRRIGIFLARGSVLRGADVLVVEDGSLLRVQAQPQPVLVVTATHPHDLLRAAYHLGNRHVPLELQPQRLQLEPDPVLADMLRRQGLQVVEALAPFEPEGGAYGDGVSGQRHGHPHGHEHGHEHDHGPDHGHSHGPGSALPVDRA